MFLVFIITMLFLKGRILHGLGKARDQQLLDSVDSCHTSKYWYSGSPLAVIGRLKTTFKQIRNNYNAIISSVNNASSV